MGDAVQAEEVFAVALERVWLALAGFEGRSSFRTWFYALVRNAMHDRGRSARRARRDVALDDTPSAHLIAEMRSVTRPYLITANKDGVTRLRDALDPAERELLILRIDRGLAWAEVAAILGAPEATCRKRFERLTTKLRALAERAGLLEP